MSSYPPCDRPRLPVVRTPTPIGTRRLEAGLAAPNTAKKSTLGGSQGYDSCVRCTDTYRSNHGNYGVKSVYHHHGNSKA